MAQITVIYKDYEEMVEVARQILKGETEREEKASPAPGPDPQKDSAKAQGTVSASVPYGRQIAPHFPNANVSQQASTQEGSVATVPATYSLDDLSSAAMTLMDKGMQIQLQQLLAGYDVASLPELPKEQYGNFATALRGMGAQI